MHLFQLIVANSGSRAMLLLPVLFLGCGNEHLPDSNVPNTLEAVDVLPVGKVSSEVEDLMVYVRSKDDVFVEQEGRGLVEIEDVSPLIEVYWTLTDWDEKRCLINLIQDFRVHGIEKVMLDYLRAPPDTTGDVVELTKAVALSFVDERYDRFTEYYEDREKLRIDVENCLRENGLTMIQGLPE